jgi:serine/threonine protein kinase
MGIVYLAKDTTLSRDVALKVIPRELALDPKAIGDLKRETAIALDLTHEHIVRLYNLETWEGQAFVIMEYVPGQTLSHLLSRKGGKLPLDEALPLIREMAAAIDYAHDRKRPVIHRDIKPLNILLTHEGRVKIADFGLARVMRDSASRLSGHSTAGTLAYMSPEQVRGKGIGPWSDIYALAAVAYEMLFGEPPFYTGDLQWQIMNELPDPIAGLPDQVNKALLTCLSKDKGKRPQCAMDFIRLLEKKFMGRAASERTRRLNSGGVTWQEISECKFFENNAKVDTHDEEIKLASQFSSSISLPKNNEKNLPSLDLESYDFSNDIFSNEMLKSNQTNLIRLLLLRNEPDENIIKLLAIFYKKSVSWAKQRYNTYQKKDGGYGCRGTGRHKDGSQGRSDPKLAELKTY